MEQDADLKGDLAQNLPVPSTSALGLTRTYARDWTPSDAFRELYQNWKDAIIQSYNLGATDFNPILDDDEDKVLITVHRQGAADPLMEECLGYIRFKKEVGTVEFTNFGAIMSPSCLEMGYSTKTEDVRLAGRHGEGLKIAALVMRRNGFHVRICSNSSFWNFGFRGKKQNEFYYQLNRASDSRVASLRTKFNTGREKGTPRELNPNIWEDVSVTVGQIRRHGKPVSVETFSEWRKATIDLHRPSRLVHTPYGKLILDPAYAGQLYVKGLRVTLADSREMQYRYSYDFLGPDIAPNRDRRLEVHPEREAKAVTAIWDAAIKDGDDVIHIYADLLKGAPGCADVAFADTYVTRITAQKVWACLAADAEKNHFFYFPAGHEDDNVQLIRYELKYEPVPLPYRLWRLLRNYGLVKLPFEEIYHRFQQSKEIEPPMTMFSQQTSRAFGALFGMHAPSKNTRIIYVQFKDNLPNVAYSKKDDILYVHEKWLDFKRAHGTSPCEISEIGDTNADSFCDHVVDDMFKSAILAVRRPIDPPYQIMVKDVQSLQGLIRKCKVKTREMPYNVQITRGTTGDSLRVTWKDNYNRAFAERFGSFVTYLVILHGAACILEAHRLWYRKDCITCECPRQEVPLAPNGADNVAVFEDLDGKPRFPMVARFRQASTEPSLWGLPPPPISPFIEDSPHGSIIDQRLSDVESTTSYSPVLRVSHISSDDEEVSDALPERIVKMAVHYEWYATRLAAMKTPSLASVRAMFGSLHANVLTLDTNVRETEASSSVPRSSQVQSGQYLRLTSSSGSLSILYVHEVLQVDQSMRVLVTKYSSLSRLWADDNILSASLDQRELLLHFSNFDHMGDKADADWLMVDEISGFCATERVVLHVAEKPDSGMDYFCRFAIRETDILERCSVCPLGNQVPRMVGNRRQPVLSALPAPAVFDFSPQDIGLSVGFQRAGCQIDRAVGDVDTHRLWQAHNPEARLFDDVGKALDSQERPFEPPLSRIAVISTNVSGPIVMHDELSSVESLVSALSTCCLVAEHMSNPEFIFLAINYAGWMDSDSFLLNRAILRLLEAKYSVHIRLHAVTAALPEDNPVFFVLAAPLSMDPQDLDNIVNDISYSRFFKAAELSGGAHDPEAIAVAKGFDRRTVDLLTPSDYKQVLLGLNLSQVMDQETLRTIRAISHHRAVNYYYKICYTLLRLLEEFIQSAIAGLLQQRASDSNHDCYDAAAKIAVRIRKEILRFQKHKADAVTAWKSLTGGNP